MKNDYNQVNLWISMNFLAMKQEILLYVCVDIQGTVF